MTLLYPQIREPLNHHHNAFPCVNSNSQRPQLPTSGEEDRLEFSALNRMSRSQQTTSEEKAEDCDRQPEVVGDFKETALSGHNWAVAHMELQHEKDLCKLEGERIPKGRWER